MNFKRVNRKRKAGGFLGVLVFLLAGCGNAPEADYPAAKWCSRGAKTGYTRGREGRKIDRIILYTTEHAADRARALWNESDSLSGHYIVTHKGEVWQLLKDADTGWHAGNREYNLRSIAIATEGFADPLNPENPTRRASWQTDEELEALVRLISWLCERHEIALDRVHIIGKNQVPGERSGGFPLGGPRYWGGASNKSSPGALWNWARLMEKLGRKPVYRTLTATTECPILTLPETNAPLICSIHAGKTLQAYDRHQGYSLVIVTEESVRQPYLEAGRHHWDGWVEDRFLTESGTTDRHPTP